MQGSTRPPAPSPSVPRNRDRAERSDELHRERIAQRAAHVRALNDLVTDLRQLMAIGPKASCELVGLPAGEGIGPQTAGARGDIPARAEHPPAFYIPGVLAKRGNRAIVHLKSLPFSGYVPRAAAPLHIHSISTRR